MAFSTDSALLLREIIPNLLSICRTTSTVLANSGSVFSSTLSKTFDKYSPLSLVPTSNLNPSPRNLANSSSLDIPVCFLGNSGVFLMTIFSSNRLSSSSLGPVISSSMLSLILVSILSFLRCSIISSSSAILTLPPAFLYSWYWSIALVK